MMLLLRLIFWKFSGIAGNLNKAINGVKHGGGGGGGSHMAQRGITVSCQMASLVTEHLSMIFGT